MTDDYKTYRDVQEMPDGDLTNMIRFVSEPYWPWRSGDIDDNANLDDSQSIRKTDDSNKDKDEQEPKGLKLTAIPDRREGVLNDSTESESHVPDHVLRPSDASVVTCDFCSC